MSFRSDRNQALQNGLINYLPALTKQHTYNLLATLYPYATQLTGEIALQADLIYKFKKGSTLGGKYGTTVQMNYASANGLDTTNLKDGDTKRRGYNSTYLGFGEVYFKDFNITVQKKINKKFKGSLTYANLVYNQNVIEVKNNKKDVFANVGIADVSYKFNRKASIRSEFQTLFTDQDLGNWATALIEFSYAPHWFIAVQDQYNYGNEDADSRVHYYNVSAGYNNGGNRVSASYGRQRAGIFCVGGVCRVVPASNGLYVSITSSF